MKQTAIHLHPSFAVGEVDPRVFGGFLEHLGRAVYQGVYDPDSTHADERGYRQDVIEALKKLRFTAMRYPGGNFVSGYDWTHGIGPRESRPKQRDLAWQSIETNQFGTDEFLTLSKEMDWTPMIAVNLGTGSPADARNWLEYCNGQPGTYWADRRVANGNAEPYGVNLWCLGNEMDGPWQICHMPAEEYALRAHQTARLMKMFDPDVELVVCGSCAIDLPTYMEWDRRVLEHTCSAVDYISLHCYLGNEKDDTAEFLCSGVAVDRQIEEVDAVCRYVQAKAKSKKRVKLSFDEWNVWYRARSGDHVRGHWTVAPHLLEEVYNLEDALVVAQFMNSFVRHADCVKIANLAQIVNAIAPILTRGDDMVLQPTYYPFEMFSSRREGIALQTGSVGGRVESKCHGSIEQVDSSAILNGRELSVFLVNRSVDEAADVRIDLGGTKLSKAISCEIVTGTDPKAINAFGSKPSVVSQAYDEVCFTEGAAMTTLPPLSFVAMTIT